MCDVTIKELEKVVTCPENEIKPIYGICLGNQHRDLAAGGKAKKLRFRNQGQNVTVLYHQTGECYITRQNHGYHIHCDTLKIVGKFHVQMLTMEVTKVSHMKLDHME